MKDITLEQLLEAGCHFGHQVTRQNPRARDFVFEARDGIHIIDLAKTKEGLDEALHFVKDMGSKNLSLLIVGTKRQAQPIVLEAVKRAQESIASLAKPNDEGKKVEADVYYVTSHWTGGTLTNFQAVQKNFQRLHDLGYLLQSSEEKEKYTKKELGLFEKERQKLEGFYAGVANMKKLPDLLFVIDTHTENIAVREANRTRIPVVGIVDTNADPDLVNYVIPANDDAVGSIELITKAIIDAWIEGKLAKPEVKKEAPLRQGSEGQAKEEKPVKKAKPAKKKTAKK